MSETYVVCSLKLNAIEIVVTVSTDIKNAFLPPDDSHGRRETRLQIIFAVMSILFLPHHAIVFGFFDDIKQKPSECENNGLRY